jgi:hypothetical protein
MASKKNFAFKLGQRVTIAESGETGEVIGRAHYTYADPSYLIRYRAGDGRAVESWWTEDALTAAPEG